MLELLCVCLFRWKAELELYQTTSIITVAFFSIQETNLIILYTSDLILPGSGHKRFETY